MFEADSQNSASSPSVPRGFELQNFFGPPSAGTIGGPWEGGGGPSQPPLPPNTTSDPPPPPLLIHPCGTLTAPPADDGYRRPPRPARPAPQDYTYEHFAAFFPLYPLLVRAVAATLLRPCHRLLPPRAVLALAGALLSNAAFVGAAVLLYHLSARVTGSRRVACAAALLFCISPASVFMSVAYTESLYTVLAFGGMLLWSDARRWCVPVRLPPPSFLSKNFLKNFFEIFLYFFGFFLASFFLKFSQMFC